MKSQLIVLIIVLLFTVLLKLPTLGINHNEGDEQIYLSLAKNLYNNGDYSLQGTEILRHLPPEIYNKPFFHHPPAYLFMMFPFMYVLGDNYAVIVSWVGHLLLIVAVFMLVLKHIDKQKKWLLPVILLMVAFDPLMIFTSQKIWFDSCMVGFFAFSIALLYEGLFAARLGIRRSLFALSGLFFALAVLMKILVGALAPLFSLIFWQHGYFKDINRGKILDALCLLIPSLVLLLPWFIKFYSVYGVLTPYWLNEPTNQALTNRFIAIVAARPWYYYIKELVLIYPAMSLMVFLVIVKRGKKIFEMSTYQVAMIFWFVSFFAFMTYISIGRVWLMRYMVLCLPPMYILPAINCKEEADEKKGNPLYAALLASWLAINCLSSVFYMVMYNYADMLSLAESIKGLL